MKNCNLRYQSNIQRDHHLKNTQPSQLMMTSINQSICMLMPCTAKLCTIVGPPKHVVQYTVKTWMHTLHPRVLGWLFKFK